MFETVVVSRLSVDWRGVSLHRSGGRGDRGVDFFGTFHPSDDHALLSVVGQCKNHARKLGAISVRDFASAVREEEFGVLVSGAGFTREAVYFASHGVKDRALMLLHMELEKEEKESRDAHVCELHINAAAQQRWPQLGVGIVGGTLRRPVLLWKDKAVLERK